MSAIEMVEISRAFGKRHTNVTALKDVSFSVPEGEVVALLGVNGAGKTTLTKILSTLLLPTSGTARIMGHDVVREVSAVRALTSVVFGGERGLYGRLSGVNNLRFFGMLAGVPHRDLAKRSEALLASVGLSDAAGRRVETYSRGMKQRLHVAIGLVSRPAVLLLDEPTVGLDPIEADRLRRAIAELREEGVSVLLTSHNLTDVEYLASRVVMLSRGRKTADLPLSEFTAHAGYVATVTVQVRGRNPSGWTSLPSGIVVERVDVGEGGAELVLRLSAWKPDVFHGLAMVLADHDVVDIAVRPAPLDEAFARLAG